VLRESRIRPTRFDRRHTVLTSMAVPVMNFIGRRIDAVRRGVGPTLDDVPEPGDVFDLFGG